MTRAQWSLNFHGDVGPSSFSPCSKSAETMEEGEKVGECGGENRGRKELADWGLEKKGHSGTSRTA